MKKGTQCVHAGYTPGKGEPRQIPIYQSTTFKYEDSDQMGRLFDLEDSGYFYTRLQNPTNDAVAARIAALEGGVAAMLTSSGQAANFFACFNICEAGGHIVAASGIYGGTFNLLGTTFAKMGIEVSFVDQDAGYTEPDPRLDLSGRDVLRKLLILSREAGVPLEEADVKIEPILAPDYFKGGVAAFYEKLEAGEAGFREAFGGNKRYIATLERKEDGSYAASIGLKELPADHPLARLSGTDNCAVLTTDFYPSPLIVQGAGAGAVQTASGVLNDILL